MEQAAEERKPLRQPLRKDEQLFFMHIPKTAGTSLIAVLDQHFTNDEICPLDRGTRKNFLSLPEEARKRFRFIRGHFPYSVVDDLIRPRTITFLRDPVRRTLSAIHHHYRLEEQGVPSFKDIILQGKSLEDFIAHPVLGDFVVNKANKYLNDMIERRAPGARLPSLALAEERLAKFDFIGITERFDESMELLSHTFGFPLIQEFPKLQAAPERRQKVSQAVLNRLAEMNRDEIELYQFGVNLFKERLAAMKREREQTDLNPPLPPPDGHIWFDFRRVDPGQGWHTGEWTPQRGIARWSGPETTSRLRFPVQMHGDRIIRIGIWQAISPPVLQSLSLEVNGRHIPLSMREAEPSAPFLFEGIVPAAVTRGRNEIILEFRVGETHLPGEFDPQNEDVRRLGICYNWLHIYPA